MCTGSDLIARVAGARMTYAENLVSGDLLGACLGLCVRAVPECGVRRCGVGARRESGQQHGCWEAVSGAAGGRCMLVESPLQRRGHVWALCGRARGGLGDTVSSRSVGSSMRGCLGWCCGRWLFRGLCASRRLQHSCAGRRLLHNVGGRVLYGKVPNNAYSQGSQEFRASAGA
jgi:hypothetical protein